jgi:hypothetical protein
MMSGWLNMRWALFAVRRDLRHAPWRLLNKIAR